MKAEVFAVRKALWMTLASVVLTLAFSLFSGLSAWFSRAVSLPLSQLLSSVFSAVDFAVAEVMLVVGLPGIACALVWSAFRKKPPKRATLALSAMLLVYTIAWTPLNHVPPQKVQPYETWRLIALCQTLGEQADALRDRAQPSDTLLEDARDAVSSLNISARRLAAPKFSSFPAILRALRIGGLYAPWTGETIISPLEPDFSLPFLASHELAHAAGIAREDEANFAAYRACMAGDERFQYSGTIYALRYAMDALRGIDLDRWFAIRREFSPGVREDFTRISDNGNATRGFSAFSDRAAEAFLKISGQPAGLSSYTGMVNHLLSDVSLIDQPQTLQREQAVQYID